MFKFLKKDSFWLGLAMGIIMPGVLFLIMYYANLLVHNSQGKSYLTIPTLQILSLVINLIVMRYYLVNLKADKTGRGILLVTFVVGIAFFIFNL